MKRRPDTAPARIVLVGAMAVAALCVPAPATGYSVLAHEANIDALWDTTIRPMLQARFPDTTSDQLLDARGYAYGGCHVMVELALDVIQVAAAYAPEAYHRFIGFRAQGAPRASLPRDGIEMKEIDLHRSAAPRAEHERPRCVRTMATNDPG